MRLVAIFALAMERLGIPRRPRYTWKTPTLTLMRLNSFRSAKTEGKANSLDRRILKNTMHTGNLFLVSAPSGAGKTSIVNAALTADEQLVVSVSHTTRPARGGEVDGKNYHFVSDEMFSQMIENAEFLEQANVFDNRYGTSKAEVANKRDQGRDVILEIDWQGAQQVRETMPQAISVFILPPSVDALAARLTSRGEDTKESIEKRLGEAKLDISQAEHFDYLVVNEDFDQAVQDFIAIVRAARLQTKVQMRHPSIKRLVHAEE